MVTKTYTSLINGQTFQAESDVLARGRHPTGEDAHTISGVSTLAVGFYKGELLKFCVSCEAAVRYIMSRYRPSFPGFGSSGPLPSYTVSRQVDRYIEATYRYFWQKPNDVREYLAGTEVTYRAHDIRRHEIDTVVFSHVYPTFPIEWIPGMRENRTCNLVEKEIGTSIHCGSVDISRKMAFFWRCEVEEPVTSVEGDGWVYVLVWRDGLGNDNSTGAYSTREGMVEAYRTLHGMLNLQVVRGAGSVQAVLPDRHYVRPASKVYAHVYLPDGSLYREKISEYQAVEGDTWNDIWYAGPGTHYCDYKTPGVTEFAMGGVYGLRTQTDAAVAEMPRLAGLRYPQFGSSIGILATPYNQLQGLVLQPSSSVEFLIPAAIEPNYALPSSASEAAKALASAQEAADWPGGGYFAEQLGPAFGIPTKKPA